MKIPHQLHRKSWRPKDRVVVATGEFKGKHGSITGRADKHQYLVLLDGEKLPRPFHKGNLDKEQ